jgi:hypothetical protein
MSVVQIKRGAEREQTHTFRRRSPQRLVDHFHDLQPGSSATIASFKWCAEPNANGVRKSRDRYKD